MRSRSLIYIVTAALLAQLTGEPVFAQRRGGGGGGHRGGSVQRHGGSRRGATTVRGPRGGAAVRAHGPRGSVSAARGPRGGGGARVTGRHGGSRAVARGPRGGTAWARNSYTWGGRSFYRPAWNAHRINGFGRGFVGYPGWRPYGTWGLTPGLAAFGGLAFLSAGLLIGSYAQQERTVYVYVVNEGGWNVEYRVDQFGNIISRRVVN